MADSLYWVWLAECMGAGSKAYGTLLERFGSPYEIYRADEESFYKTPGLSERDFEKLCDKNLDKAHKIVDYCTRNGIGILTYDSNKFPERLKGLRDSPVVLYYRGTLPDFDRRLCVAVVGTRKMTEYGERATYTVSYELASAGAVIVSGMALGVDGIASCATIEAGGTTCAVLGSGIDVVYPPEHKKLMEAILRHGAVITEYAPGTKPLKPHFPARNRIISGLCQGTFVAEGDTRSGALITAKEALYQGRSVYALPGNIDTVNSSGANKLLKEGAKIVTSAEDIISDHEFLYSDSISYERLNASKENSFYNRDAVERLNICSRRSTALGKKKQDTHIEMPKEKETPQKEKKGLFGGILKKKKEADTSLLDDISKKVYDMIPCEGAVSVDTLSRGDISVSDVMTALTLLEINGFIDSLPGGVYVKR